MFYEQSSCQNTSRQKNIGIKSSLMSQKHLSWKHFDKFQKRKHKVRVLFICYTHSKSTRLKRNMHVVLQRTFLIYWCLRWEWTTEPLQPLIHWVDESNGSEPCYHGFIGLGIAHGICITWYISIIVHVFLKLCIMYFYHKGQYLQIVWLEHVIHPMFSSFDVYLKNH
jgi:hypothetical protein